jgi:hypothetical protein
MDPVILAILSVVLGGISGGISGAISSRLQLPIQTRQGLSLKLFEKRAETLPLLYEILSDFIKR